MTAFIIIVALFYSVSRLTRYAKENPTQAVQAANWARKFFK